MVTFIYSSIRQRTAQLNKQWTEDRHLRACYNIWNVLNDRMDNVYIRYRPIESLILYRDCQKKSWKRTVLKSCSFPSCCNEKNVKYQLGWATLILAWSGWRVLNIIRGKTRISAWRQMHCTVYSQRTGHDRPLPFYFTFFFTSAKGRRSRFWWRSGSF